MTSARTTLRPRKATRARTQARGTPRTTATSRAPTEDSRDSRRAWITSGAVRIDPRLDHGVRRSRPPRGSPTRTTAPAASRPRPTGSRPEGGQYPVQLARAGGRGGGCYPAGCFKSFSSCFAAFLPASAHVVRWRSPGLEDLTAPCSAAATCTRTDFTKPLLFMGDGGYLVARPMPELAPVVRTVWVTTLNLTARAGSAG